MRPSVWPRRWSINSRATPDLRCASTTKRSSSQIPDVRAHDENVRNHMASPANEVVALRDRHLDECVRTEHGIFELIDRRVGAAHRRLAQGMRLQGLPDDRQIGRERLTYRHPDSSNVVNRLATDDRREHSHGRQDRQPAADLLTVLRNRRGTRGRARPPGALRSTRTPSRTCTRVRLVRESIARRRRALHRSQSGARRGRADPARDHRSPPAGPSWPAPRSPRPGTTSADNTSPHARRRSPRSSRHPTRGRNGPAEPGSRRAARSARRPRDG